MAHHRRSARLRAATLAGALLSASALAPAGAQARFGEETLSKGDSGADVRGLQRALSDAGYETGVDGEFGAQTVRRVRAFEGDERLRVDGRVTPRDAVVLEEAAEERSPGSDENTAPDGEEVAGSRATLDDDGLAVAPADAPQEVKDAIEAGNEIAETPYKYGGGHGKLKDSGYDCSGSISYSLRKAGLMDESMASGAMMSFGDSGRGEWITLYANAGHAYMVIAGLRFDTSARKRSGTRWSATARSARGYSARHPEGF